MSKKNTKKIGIKQVFKVSEKESLVFGYGEKNIHKIDKKIDNENKIIEINNESKFNLLKKDEKNLEAKKKNSNSDLCATILNPYFSKENNNFRNEMEKIFYDVTDENEIKNNSIYIQIASNIFDINKIISPYINEIISSLNSILYSNNFKEPRDFIGNLKYSIDQNSKNSNEAKKNELVKMLKNNPLKYYNNIFENDWKDIKEYSNEVFNFFIFLSLIRQSTFHFKGFDHFQIDKLSKNIKDSFDIERFLNEIFAKKSKVILESFEKNNLNTNFLILKKIYGGNIKTIYKEFYEYVILEKSKYLGFSVKKIREEIIKELLTEEEMKNDEVSSKKRKINLFFDFRIYLEFKNNYLIEEIKEILRENSGVDAEIYFKIYEKYFKKDKDKYQKDLSLILEKSNYNDKKSNVNDKHLDKDFLSEQEEIFNKYNVFSKALFVVSLFLDNKEANELLSTIVNKLDNIHSFMKIEYNNRKLFNESYMRSTFNMFKKSDVLSEEIKVVKRFINMLNVKNKEKKNQGKTNLLEQIPFIEDFLQLFFIKKPVFLQINQKLDLNPIEEIIQEFNKIDYLVENVDLNKISKNKYVIKIEDYNNKLNEFKEIIYNYSQNKKNSVDFNSFKSELKKVIFEGKSSNSSKKNNIKASKLKKIFLNKEQTNLILNSILKSNFFIYLMKHMSPKKTASIIENKDITINVLKQLNQNEIDRIYLSIKNNETNNSTISYAEKINFLYDEIKNFEILSILSKKNKNKKTNCKKNSNIINIVELYVKILYLVFKNLININFRYSTAVYMLERDIIFTCMKNQKNYTNYSENYIQESKEHTENHRINEKDFNSCYVSPIIFPDTFVQNLMTKKDELVDYSHKKYGYFCLNEYEKDSFENNKSSGKEKIEYSNYLFKSYRNFISHLHIIDYCKKYSEYFVFKKGNKYNNMYFQLYHTIMNKYLSEIKEIKYLLGEGNLEKLRTIFADEQNETLNKKILDKFKKIFAYEHFKKDFNDKEFEKFKKGSEKILREIMKSLTKKTYSKKILSILNIPFSYNKARYNNLTYEHLFDKNAKREEKDLNDEK